MDQDIANALFEKGAILLFLDAPQNLEFGIDCYSWTTGPKFKGLKLIPPGMHFVYYSALNRYGEGAARTGFFKNFKPREVVVKRWNPVTEDLYADDEMNAEEAERYRINFREFDQFLGAYPLVAVDNDPITPYQKWLGLTTHATLSLATRILPPSGKVSSMTSVSRFSDVQDTRPEFRSRGRDSSDDGKPVMATISDTPVTTTISKQSSVTVMDDDQAKVVIRGERVEVLKLNFTPVDLKRSFPPGASGSELTKHSIDKSYLLRQLLKTYYGDCKELLGELQLSFVIFLLGEVYDGYEQWKTLIHVICQSDEAVEEYGSTLFYEFTVVFRAQLEAHPADFFQDALSLDNFIRANLLSLVRTVRGRSVPKALQSGMDSLLDFVEDKFKWDIRHEVQVLGEEEETEEGEYAPVVVEL